MKKVSTVAAKPSRKISQQKLTIGLDLGDRNSWYCVLDESGQIQVEQRVRTNAKALREVFGEMPHSRITHSYCPAFIANASVTNGLKEAVQIAEKSKPKRKPGRSRCCVPWEMALPAGENAGVRDDAVYQGIKGGPQARFC